MRQPLVQTFPNTKYSLEDAQQRATGGQLVNHARPRAIALISAN
jgi:hypothetical protein